MRLLFDVSTATQLTLAAETARRAKKLDVEVAFNFSGESVDVRNAVERTAAELSCRWTSQADVTAELANRQTSRAEALVKRLSEAAERQAQKLLDITPNHKVDRMVTIMRREIAAARELLRRHRASAVIVGEDGVGGNAALVKAAHDIGLVVLVVPYEVSGREDFLNYIEEKHRDGNLVILGDDDNDRRVAKRYPHWVQDTAYGKAVIYAPHYILARETARLGVKDPWTTQGGAADYLACGSKAMYEHYRREGLPKGKLRWLGSPYCDAIADVLAGEPTCARACAEATKIVSGRTRILLSLPPSYHESRRGTNEFATYEEMCRSLVDACASIPGAEVTLSIHPATPPDQRAMLERLDATVIPEWVIRLIPRHDVYVTSFSSTIRWALACGKPVINYDAYQFRLEVFRDARAMTTTNRAAEVASLVARLADDEAYGRAAKQAADDAHRWGTLDGGNTRRIVEFLKRARRRDTKGAMLRIMQMVGLL
jgi:hypothetical protein